MKSTNNIFKSDKQFNCGILSLFALSLISASMGIFMRTLGQELQLFQQLSFRLSAAFLVTILLFYKDIDYEKLKKMTNRDWTVTSSRTLFMYLFGISSVTIAFIRSSNYGNISFILALPMVAILGVLILKEKMTLIKALLILLSFIGVVIISVDSFANITNWDISSLFALVGTTSMAMNAILRNKHTNLLNDKEIAALMLFIAAFITTLISFLLGERISSVNWSLNLIFMIMLAGLFNALIIFFINYGYSKVNPLTANNIVATQSLFGVLIGIVFYQEVIGIREIIGGTFIILSVIAFNKLRGKE
ncbi:MAG: DMT family transporter [Defluviitaleaceae bacterium]|nr:DMT family transporter [Defluviitaleaceae bacterium]